MNLFIFVISLLHLLFNHSLFFECNLLCKFQPLLKYMGSSLSSLLSYSQIHTHTRICPHPYSPCPTHPHKPHTPPARAPSTGAPRWRPCCWAPRGGWHGAGHHKRQNLRRQASAGWATMCVWWWRPHPTTALWACR